jgi:hypothetical protein
VSLFPTPEEHAAHPPESWQVRKRAPRLWGLFARPTDTEPLESFTTRREAEANKITGHLVNLYQIEEQWFAGETPHGWRPYADVAAERERRAARWPEQNRPYVCATCTTGEARNETR